METEIKSNKAKNKKKATNNNLKKINKKKSSPKKNGKKIKKILIILVSIILFIGLTVVILLSDLFNIKQITVVNNSRVSKEEIIKQSTLQIGSNMFKTLSIKIINGVKTNPYIENVKVKKKLNGEIVIEVEERTCSYMLQMENEFAYINNQGYILEISNNALQVPVIKGYLTQEIVPGNRLDVKDLKKLDTIIQIMETAKSNGIKDIITGIDITDENNFILEIPSEGKTVQFGDESNINIKILWIVDLINREKGIEGEIIVNVPDIKKVYFREKV